MRTQPSPNPRVEAYAGGFVVVFAVPRGEGVQLESRQVWTGAKFVPLQHHGVKLFSTVEDATAALVVAADFIASVPSMVGHVR
mgnify:CR=1 FL=1